MLTFQVDSPTKASLYMASVKLLSNHVILDKVRYLTVGKASAVLLHSIYLEIARMSLLSQD